MVALIVAFMVAVRQPREVKHESIRLVTTPITATTDETPMALVCFHMVSLVVVLEQPSRTTMRAIV